jgi:ABC-2 type transport system permease protein
VKAFMAQLGIELRLIARRQESLLVTLVIPLALLVFFGSVNPFGTNETGGLDFVVPGLLALAAMSTSMVSLGIATAFERYYGALKRLLGSPLPRLSLLSAKAASVVVLEIAQIVLLLGVARLLYGWAPKGSLPVAVGVLLLGSLAFAGLGLLMAGTLRAEATLALANGLYLVFLLVGGFVFPVDRLPGPILAVTEYLPATALSTGTRIALGGAQGLLGESVIVLGMWTVASIVAASMTFRAD